MFSEEEVPKNINTHFLRVDGVKQPVAFYTLDVIISVGYRVKSKRGTSFRQWANQVLKDYLLKGYSVNKSLQEVKTQLGTQDKRISLLEDKVDFFVRSSLPPVEGIFYDGQIFDAYAQIINLIKQAKRSIVLIDNYISTDTPHFLCPYDNILPNSTSLSQIPHSVATTKRRFWPNLWNQPKIALPLQHQKTVFFFILHKV